MSEGQKNGKSNGQWPVRTRRFDDFPGYDGWWVDIRVNVPMATVHKMEQGGYDNIYEALEEFVVEWNFTDRDGQPIPVTREGMEAGLPIDMFILLQRRIWAVLRDPLAETKQPGS